MRFDDAHVAHFAFRSPHFCSMLFSRALVVIAALQLAQAQDCTSNDSGQCDFDPFNPVVCGPGTFGALVSALGNVLRPLTFSRFIDFLVTRQELRL